MSNTAAFPLRVPADMKAWMEAQAQLNRSSQNSEVVRAIRAAMSEGLVYVVGENETAEEFADNFVRFAAANAVARGK